MTRKVCFIPVFLVLFSFASFAQENCSNGIDDDGDGFVDCYDSQCANSSDCDDFFMNDNPDCEAKPTENPTFSLTEAFRSSEHIWGSNHTIVGDFNNDGIPDIFAIRRNSDNYVYIFNGNDGSLLNKVAIGGSDAYPGYFMALCDTEKDGFPELILTRKQGNKYQLYAFDYNGVKWGGSGATIEGSNSNPESVGAIGVADFNEDGETEIYVRNSVYNAKTGQLISKGDKPPVSDFRLLNAGPVAVDVLDDSDCDDCAGLELVIGDKVYSVDVEGKKVTLVREMDAEEFAPVTINYGTLINFSKTSVADIDNDGDLDAIFPGLVREKSGWTWTEETSVWYWDIQTDEYRYIKTSDINPDNTNSANDWKWGTGRVNVSDMNGDGQMDISFDAGTYLYAITYNAAAKQFQKMWYLEVTDLSSGFTGSAVFDFNGDGSAEMIYRDQDYLYIITTDKATGTLKSTSKQPCTSQTYADYPVVVDVNGDGATEIVVSCIDGTASAATDNLGRIIVFKSDGELWVPSRKVWNQHGYFNVNINDDLTVPKEQQLHHKVFSSGMCEGATGEARPLNNFLNQSPYLDINGCMNYPSPDLTFDDNSITITPPTCPATDFSVGFTLINNGDAPISGDLQIGFYANAVHPDSLLNIQTVNVSKINPGDSLEVNDILVNGTGKNFTLFVKINDGNPPAIAECKPENNVFSASIVALPFSIGSLKLADNYKCVDSLADNGRARAFVLPDSSTAGYTFIWLKSNGVSYDSVYSGFDYPSMAEGDYMVTARHTLKQCGSDTVAAGPIGRISAAQETVKIEQTAPFTSCKDPDGELTARIYVISGTDSVEQDPGDYEFKWYDGSVFVVTPPIDFDPVASGLSDRDYKVEIRNTITGCALTPVSGTVTSEAKRPLIDGFTITHIEACGEKGIIEVASAITSSNEELDPQNDLVYRWYADPANPAGSLMPNDSTYRVDSLAGGTYGVVGIMHSNGCPSNLAPVTVNDVSSAPNITVSVVGSSSCDGVYPDGQLTIEYHDAKPPQYTITVNPWDNTTGNWGTAIYQDNLKGGNSVTLTSLKPNTYRIEARHNAFTCFSETFTITDESAPLDPAGIAITSVPQTNCNDAAPNGSISATFNGQTSAYVFDWYQGGSVKASPDYSGSLYNGIVDSIYTLIVTDTLTGCKTTAVVDTVRFSPALPLPATSVTPNISCESPNGTLLATANPAGTYTFEVFDGSTKLNSAVNLNGSTGLQTTGLGVTGGAKSYKVVVTNESSLCSASVFAQVDYQPDVPVITAANIIMNSNAMCVAPYDGAIDATASVASAATDYEFFWVGPTGSINEKGSILDSLYGGTYSLEVKKISSGCISAASNKATVTVGNAFIYPTITLNVNKEQTACAGPVNGELAGSAQMPSGPEPAAGYKFRWSYSGTGLDSAVIATLPSRDTLSGLAGARTYQLKVTNNNTGCFTADDIFLPEVIQYPMISDNITVSPNGYCATPFNGVIDASAAPYMQNPAYEPATGYTFKWFNAANAPINNTGAAMDSLPAAVYKLKVVNNYTLCESQTYKLIEVTNAFDPILAHIDTINHQTHCSLDESLHNGALRASALVNSVKTTGGYQFEWRRGISMSLPVIGNDPLITGLTDVTYRVKVTSDSTRCYGVADALIRYRPEFPEVDTITTPVTLCAPTFNGIAEATVDNSASYHSFYWSEGSTVKSIPDHTASVYNNLAPGEYTVYAVVDSTLCPSDPVTVTVADNTLKVKVEFDTLNTPAHCSATSGGLRVRSVTSGVSSLNFDWYKGTSSAPPFYSSNGTVSQYFEIESGVNMRPGLGYGHYYFTMTNPDDGCETDTSFYMPFIGESELSIPAVMNAKLCKDPFFGSIEVDLDVHDSVAAMGFDKYDFLYVLYEGVHVIGDGKDFNDAHKLLFPAGNASVPLRFDSLRKGTYTISVVDIWDGNMCEEKPLDRIIEIGVDLPKVTASVINPDFSCDPARPNGALTATATSAPDLDVLGYTFNWYENNTSSASLGSGIVSGPNQNVSSIYGLKDATYVVRAYNDSTGCDTTATVSLIKDLRDLTIRNISSLPQDQCGFGNGSILVGDMWEDNVSYTSTFSYTLEATNTVTSEVALNQELNVAIDSLTAGVYMIKAVNDSTLCETFIDYEVGIDTLNPSIVAQSIIHDEYCAPLNVGNGEIMAAIDESLQAGGNASATAGYVFEWFDAAGNSLAAAANHLSSRPSGFYIVKVTDTDGKYLHCVSSDTIEIKENNPAVAITEIVATDQTYCVGDNGTIEATEVTLNGQVIPSTDFTIELLEGTISTGQPFIRNEGAYQLRAIYNAFQCVSDTVTAEIGLDHPVYSFNFSAIEDFSCDNINGQGELSATVFENGIQLPNGYTLQWYDQGMNAIGAASSISGLIDGRYYLTMTDTDSRGLGCVFSDSIELADDFKDIVITALNIAPQSICLPNGAISITAVAEDGVNSGNAYTFALLDGNGNALTPSGTGSPADPFTSLTAGDYYISAVNTLTGCETTSNKEARIEDTSVNPLVNLSVVHEQDRLSPPAIPSGIAMAAGAEVNGPAGLYDITWHYDGAQVSSASSVPSHMLVDRPAGWHTAVVRNVATNCSVSGQIEIPEHIASPEVTLSSAPASDCNGSGTIDVTSVRVAGVAQNASDFDFDLYSDFVASSNLVSTIDGSQTSAFVNLQPGVYYVVARLRDVNNYLESEPFQIEVADQAIRPVIDQREILPQRSFNPDPLRHNGRIWLVVDGYHINNGGYEAVWSKGESLSSPYLSQFEDDFVADGLTKGFYTVQVQDINSGCSSEATYLINEELVGVEVAASAKPNTFCVGANGQMGAAVISGDLSSTYNYYWYTSGGYTPGNGNAGAVYTGNLQRGIPAGTYTVYAVDQQDEYRYGHTTVEVKPERYDPVIVITEINPQVNCDESKPTGQLTAQLAYNANPADNPSYYQIYWYDQQNPQVSIGENRWDLDRLHARSYLVKVRHKETGCETNSPAFLVSQQLDIVPTPSTEVLSHMTNCATPNGAVASSIGGVTYNYDFNWYFGPKPSARPDRINRMIYDLNTGDYTVTATRLESGCTSAPAVATVEDGRVYPELELTVKNAKCEEPNGYIHLELKNHISLDQVVWSDGFRLYYDFNLDNQPAGEYQVTVSTTEQCETTETATIKPDIMIYNGVSANGDGVNDKFVIGCIDQFYRNNVKIFNRSGDIVFETTDYDNEANSFIGEGNKGLYIGRPQLPIGTYFYIIDLKDGSTPSTGYLELVR